MKTEKEIRKELKYWDKYLDKLEKDKDKALSKKNIFGFDVNMIYERFHEDAVRTRAKIKTLEWILNEDK